MDEVNLLEQLFSEKRFHEMEEIGRKLSKVPKYEFLGWKVQGVAQRELGETNQSVESFNTCLEISRTDYQVLYNQSANYYRLMQHDRALDCILECKELNPKYDLASIHLANIYSAKKQFDLAKRELNSVTPNSNIEIALEEALAKASSEDREEYFDTMEKFETFVRLKSAYGLYLLGLRCIKFKRDDVTSAILGLSEDEFENRYWLMFIKADLMSDKRDFVTAVSFYDLALDCMSVMSPEIVVNSIRAHTQIGNHERVEELYVYYYNVIKNAPLIYREIVVEALTYNPQVDHEKANFLRDLRL